MKTLRHLSGLVVVAMLGWGAIANADDESGGPTVRVSVSATDSSGAILHYRWKSTDGSIQNADSPQTTWTLPAGPGLHFAYVLVSNGLGGYTERRITVNTDGLPSASNTNSEYEGSSVLKPPPAPAQVGDFYRAFLGLGFTDLPVPGLAYTLNHTIYAPNQQAYLQDATTGVRYPSTGGAVTNARGEYVIPNVPAGANYNLMCSGDGGVTFALCEDNTSSETLELPFATTNYDEVNYLDVFLPTPPVVLQGSLRLADGNACGVSDEFFGVHVYATVTLLNASNAPVGKSALVNEFGDFSINYDPRATSALLQCENSVVKLPVSASQRDLALTSLPVSDPIVENMTATLHGTSVGKFLPPPSGFPSDYLRRSDGYLAEKGIDSRVGGCLYYKTIGAVAGCDRRGNFQGAALTYDAWQRSVKIGRYAQRGVPQYTAAYINKVDLNLTRQHSSISYGPNQTAAVVCNHLGPPANTPDQLMNPLPADIETAITNAVTGKNLVACVAMDYQAYPGVNNGQPFVRFLIFGPDGTLLPSINLDGRAEKFVPGTCVACHGGDHYAGKFPEDGSGVANIGAHFLPYDTGNFEFSTTQAGLTEAAQTEQIYHLNQNTLSAGPTAAEQELIAGWYANEPAICPASNPRCHVLDTQYVPGNPTDPTTWQGQSVTYQQYYQQVIARSCRTCHVALIEGFNFDHFQNIAPGNFFTSNRFIDAQYEFQRSVCGEAFSAYTHSGFERLYMMPNSLVTYNRFWLSGNQLPLFNVLQEDDFNKDCFYPSTIAP